MLVQHQRYGRGNRLHPAAFVQTDSLFYRLFKQRPRFGVDLLGLNDSGKGYDFASEDIKQTNFRMDGIFC